MPEAWDTLTTEEKLYSLKTNLGEVLSAIKDINRELHEASATAKDAQSTALEVGRVVRELEQKVQAMTQ